VLAVILACLAGLAGIAAIGAGGTAIVFDQTQRDTAGYVMDGPSTYVTDTYAFVSDSYRAGVTGDVLVARDMIGKIRIRSQSTRPVFVGIGPASAVDSYLRGVRREVANRFDARRNDFHLREGGAPSAPPTTQKFWAAHAEGAGSQTLSWMPQNGSWRIVLMNANGAHGVRADVAVGAGFPRLGWMGVGAFGAGLLLVGIAGGCFCLAVGRRAR
jgi:hypothetical protein